MFPLIRVALWIVALVAPGGVLLVPFLATDMLRRRNAAPQPEASSDPSLAG
jgi:hypothetical protein